MAPKAPDLNPQCGPVCRHTVPGNPNGISRRTPHVRRLLPLVPLTLLLAACGGGGSEGGGASSGTQTIQISEKEYSLNPSTVTVSKPGTYTFEITNDGQITHAFEIEASGGGGDEEGESGDIEPGQKKMVEFELAAGQSYEMYCPIDGHRQKGMDGSVVFAGAPTGTTTKPKGETTTSEDDNSGPGY
jgi:uncharacterized cupredoxin-like copper-binding protein